MLFVIMILVLGVVALGTSFALLGPTLVESLGAFTTLALFLTLVASLLAFTIKAVMAYATRELEKEIS